MLSYLKELSEEMKRSRQRSEMRSSIKKSWILDKAETLFWQKGYHSTSMKDIASACDCKPANIYNYFKSKEDILYEVIRDITSQTVSLTKPFEEDETTSPAEQLRALIKNHFGLMVDMKKSIVLISDTGIKELSPEHRKSIIELRDTYDRIVSKIIQRGVKSGDFADVDDRIISYFLSSLIVRSNIWFSAKGRLTADQVSDIMFDFVYRGIKA
jgi:AcrR family transcriptional regulator